MIYRLYNSCAQSTNSSQSIIVREDDTIDEIVLELVPTAVADADTFYAELSFIATHSKATNDTNGVIASAQLNIELTTSGATEMSRQLVFRPNVKVFSGEKLYLHLVNTGTGTSVGYCTLATAKPGTQRAQVRR